MHRKKVSRCAVFGKEMVKWNPVHGFTNARQTQENKMRKPSKKVLAVLTAVALLAGGGTAFAYWTAGGSGTGTATLATTAALTVNQTNTAITTLVPGGPAAALTGTFTNTNAGPIHVTTLTAAVTSVAPATCLKADFVIGGTATIVGAVPNNDIPVGSTGTWSGLTISLTNTAVNQDTCKLAVPTITYTAS